MMQVPQIISTLAKDLYLTDNPVKQEEKEMKELGKAIEGLQLKQPGGKDNGKVPGGKNNGQVPGGKDDGKVR